MSEPFELKTLHAEAIPAALDKAKQYRLLNDPEPAESICLDILAVDPKNQTALITLILAMTDQFAQGTTRVQLVRQQIKKLEGEYERAYYTGILYEREARAFLGRGMAAGFAYEGFRDAMAAYEEAEKLRPKGNDDAILRWNSCVRSIRHNGLKPRPRERELPLE